MNFLNARYAAIVLGHLHGNKLMKLKHLSILIAAFLICTTTIANNLYPERGATKSQVQQKHGEPQDTKGPVGDPPITRWIYNDFSVVFEYDKALHSFPRNQGLENLPSDALPQRPEPGTTEKDKPILFRNT